MNRFRQQFDSFLPTYRRELGAYFATPMAYVFLGSVPSVFRDVHVGGCTLLRHRHGRLVTILCLASMDLHDLPARTRYASMGR